MTRRGNCAQTCSWFRCQPPTAKQILLTTDLLGNRSATFQTILTAGHKPPAGVFQYPATAAQVTNILARLAICEKASIDECYLDITAEAKHRLEASLGVPAVPVNAEQVHICGQVRPCIAPNYHLQL